MSMIMLVLTVVSIYLPIVFTEPARSGERSGEEIPASTARQEDERRLFNLPHPDQCDNLPPLYLTYSPDLADDMDREEYGTVICQASYLKYFDPDMVDYYPPVTVYEDGSYTVTTFNTEGDTMTFGLCGHHEWGCTPDIMPWEYPEPTPEPTPGPTPGPGQIIL